MRQRMEDRIQDGILFFLLVAFLAACLFVVWLIRIPYPLAQRSEPNLPTPVLGEVMATIAIEEAMEAQAAEALPTHQGKPWFGLCPADKARTVEGFRAEVERSGLLRDAYQGFDWSRAAMVTAEGPLVTFVNFRNKDGQVKWTREPLKIKAGETFITDRADPADESSGYLIRAWCCNSARVKVDVKTPREHIDLRVLTPEYYEGRAGGHTHPVVPLGPPYEEGIVPLVPPHGGLIPPIGFPPRDFGGGVPPIILVASPPPHGGYSPHPPSGPWGTFPPHDRPERPPKDRPPYHPPGGPTPPPDVETPTPIPEPSTYVLLGTGIAVLYLFRRRRDHF